MAWPDGRHAGRRITALTKPLDLVMTILGLSAARLAGSGVGIGIHKAAALSQIPYAYEPEEGEALFPDHKSIEFLLKQKERMPLSSWEALYQQNPLIIGGEIIKGKESWMEKAISDYHKERSLYGFR